VNILSHPAARLARVLYRHPRVVLVDEINPPQPVTVPPMQRIDLDVDALVASGELGYVDTTSRAELAARGLLGDRPGPRPTVTARAERAADLAAELERRTALTVDAITDLITVEHRAMQARAAFLADLDALGRAAK
jgi:hypothetical protein